MAGLGDLIVRIGANIDDFKSSMSSLISSASAAASQVEKEFEGLANVGSSLIGLGATLTASLTVPLVGVGNAALETAGKLEQTQIAFTHFLGGTQQAKAYLEELYNFAATTPFQIGDVTTGAQKLLAMGFAAKEVTPLLRILGDQLSAVGRTENLGPLILAFGEMRAKGVASMKEVRQMITDGVIPAVKYMAEAFNLSETQVFDRMKSKAIDADSAINAILQGMARETGGLMESQMGSFLGQLSNLKDQGTLTLKAIGDQLLPYGKGFVALASDMLSAVKDLAIGFGQLPEPIKAGMLALAGVAAVLPVILTFLGAIGVAWPAVVAGFAALTDGAVLTAGAFFGIGGAVAVAVAALVGIGVWVYDHWAGISAAVAQAWDGIKDLWGATWQVVSTSMSIVWNLIASNASAIFGPIGAAISIIWDVVKDQWIQVWTGLKSWLGSLWNAIADEATKAWKWITDQFKDLLAMAEKIPGVAKILNIGTAFTGAEKAAQDSRDLADALKALGVGASSASFQLETLAQKKADWAVTHKQKVDDLTAAYDKLVAGNAAGKVSDAQLAEGKAKLTAVMAEQFKTVKTGSEDSEAAHKGVSQAANLVLAAETALGQAYQTLFVPAAMDVVKAEAEVQAARERTLDSSIAVANATNNLNQILRDTPGNYAAITAAEDQLKKSELDLKQSKIDLAEAEKVAQASRKADKELNDLAAQADREYAAVIKEVVQPALVDYQVAIANLNEARRTAILSADAVKVAEGNLAAARVGQGILSVAEAEERLQAARLAATASLSDYKEKQLALNEAEKIGHAAINELEQDGKALAELYKGSLTGSIKDFGDTLQLIRNQKDQVTAASVRLTDAENALQAAQASGRPEAVRAATQAAQEARTKLKVTTDELSTAESYLSSKYGASKSVIDSLTNSTEQYTLAQQKTAAALNTLGMTSQIEYDRLAKVARDANDTIQADATASENEKRDSQIKALEAERARLIAHGQDLTQAQQDYLGKLKAQQDYFNQTHLNQWYDLYKSIVGIVNGFTTKVGDIFIQSLWGNDQNDQLKKQADDLRASMASQYQQLLAGLAQSKLAYSQYVDDVNTKLNRIGENLADNLAQKQQSTERSVADKQEAYNRDAADINQQIQALQNGPGGKSIQVQIQIQSLQVELARKKQDLDTFIDRANQDLQQYNDDQTKAAQQQTDDLKTELDRRTADYTQSLQDQQTKYDQFVADTNKKLQELKDQQITVWKQISDAIAGPNGVLNAIAKSFTASLLKPMTDAIAKFIATGIADLLKSLGGVNDVLASIGKSIGGIFNSGGATGLSQIPGIGAAAGSGNTGASIPNIGLGGGAESGASGAAGAAGGAASSAGSLLSTLSSIANIANLGVSIVSGIVTGFQNAHQETSLNAIEHNTRYSMMYLGERADGGILGVLFKIAEVVGWGPFVKDLDNISDIMSRGAGIGGGFPQAAQDDLDIIQGRSGWMLKDLDLIQDHSFWILKKLESIDAKTLAPVTVPYSTRLGGVATAGLRGNISAVGAAAGSISINGLVLPASQDVDALGNLLVKVLRQRGIVKQGSFR